MSKLTCRKERVQMLALIGTLPVHTVYMIGALYSMSVTLHKCERSYSGLRGNHWKAMESFCEKRNADSK